MRRLWLVPVAVAAALVLALALAEVRPQAPVVYPDFVLASGGSGVQAWSVVAGGEKTGDQPLDACTLLRDEHGVVAAGGCGYRPDDPSTHRFAFYVGELPDGQGQIWFGPAPDAAAAIEFRFPTESPLRVRTVTVDGVPGRFYVLIHRAPRDLHDLGNYPEVRPLDAAGRTVEV